MDWFQTIAAEVDAGQFRRSLRGELRQREVLDPIVFQGVAHIDQDAQGGLAVKFVCESASGPFDVDQGLVDPLQGKAIAEHFHFDLEGIDGDGRTWTAKRVQMRLARPSKKWGPLSKPDGLDVALGKIPELATEHPCEIEEGNRSEVTWVVPGKVPSPCRGVRFPWKSHAGECSWSVVYDNQDNTIIWFDAPLERFEVTSRHFYRALSILSSRYLQPRCSSKRTGGIEVVCVFSRKKHVEAKAFLWVPIHPSKGWTLFVEKWLSANRSCHPAKAQSDDRLIQDVIYHFWHRFYKAYSFDIENGAQVLTSSIEGMAKRYFADPPAQFVTEREREFTFTKQFLEQADRKRHARTISVLVSIIKNEEDNKRPDIDFLLATLCRTKHITESMVEAWGRIRHRAAHGDHMVRSSEDMESFEQDFFQCFEAFKRLCMFAIDYDGPAQDFSVEDWPVLRNTIR